MFHENRSINKSNICFTNKILPKTFEESNISTNPLRYLTKPSRLLSQTT